MSNSDLSKEHLDPICSARPPAVPRQPPLPAPHRPRGSHPTGTSVPAASSSLRGRRRGGRQPGQNQHSHAAGLSNSSERKKNKTTKPQNPGISGFFYFPGVRSGVSGVVCVGALCLRSLLFVVPFLAELSIYLFFKVF